MINARLPSPRTSAVLLTAALASFSGCVSVPQRQAATTSQPAIVQQGAVNAAVQAQVDLLSQRVESQDACIGDLSSQLVRVDNVNAELRATAADLTQQIGSIKGRNVQTGGFQINSGSNWATIAGAALFYPLVWRTSRKLIERAKRKRAMRQRGLGIGGQR